MNSSGECRTIVFIQKVRILLDLDTELILDQLNCLLKAHRLPMDYHPLMNR
jgi:hypothetical protein